MKVLVTFGEILNAPAIYSWDNFCLRHGYNPYMLNEGLAKKEATVEISLEEAEEYGLLQKERKRF